MKAFILAAGRGVRMGPLTDNCPKPLLDVNGTTLIEQQLFKLKSAGVSEVIINTAYLGEMIQDRLGDGADLGFSIRYSQEQEALETGGAILHALGLLGDAPFLLVNGDVWTDLDYAALIENFRGLQNTAPDEVFGHLVLVPNPGFNLEGDFAIDGDSRVLEKTSQAAKAQKALLTFSGVSILQAKLISQFPERRPIFPLREAFQWAIAQGKLTGELFSGYWLDVGTPQRLEELRRHLKRA